jgi:FKBP-type peptidyl-prolyl cis-trans isomerase
MKTSSFVFLKRQGALLVALASLSISTATYAGCAKSDNSQTSATNTQSVDPNQPMSSASTTSESSQPTASQPAAQPVAPAPAAMETAEIKPGKSGDTITTASGLKYIDTKVGTGAPVSKGQTVSVNYTGKFLNGKTFDSNVDPAFGHVQPFTTAIPGGVIQAWNEGIIGMKVGGQRHLICPPNLAYGSRGMGTAIPPNSTLTFDVELLKVQ